MKVKGGVRFIRYMIDNHSIGKNINKNFDEVISLLQQGEAYRQVWEELRESMKKGLVNKYKCDYCVSLTCNWRFPMKDLEQKYFPKGEESNNEQN